MKFLIGCLTVFVISISAYGEPCDSSSSTSTHSFVNTVIEGFFTAIGIGDAKAEYFCDEFEGECSLENALEKHRMLDIKTSDEIKSFVGHIRAYETIDGVTSGGDGTGFLFQTESCNKNNLVFINHHTLFNKTGEQRTNLTFNLNGRIYPLDTSPETLKELKKAGLIGHSKRPESETYDFAILPIKGEPPSQSIQAPQFRVLDQNFFYEKIANKNILFYGGYSKLEKSIYTGQGCRTPYYGLYIAAVNKIDDKGVDIVHNCPSPEGFSGSPLMIKDKNEGAGIDNHLISSLTHCFS